MCLLRKYRSPCILCAAQNDTSEFLVLVLAGSRVLRPRLLLLYLLIGTLQIVEQCPRIAAAKIDNQRQDQHANAAAADRNTSASETSPVLDIGTFP
jgi:hypothetical protein